ncbi:uncharacterized protein RCO7_08381 [Rhynchosporium graminicola]|uniref:Uncharacterized protein n=1 Tax=Rhynchosporium graminicola TaxID=2792576 RepID=A0A1E1KQB5_9HELO|nr:uncharacterized protein RCO7_08381 [Rhynchosporium commune]
MQQTITKVLKVLREGKPSPDRIDWLYLHEKDLPLYIQVLTEWQIGVKALKQSPMRSIFGVLSDGNERTKICVSTKLRKTSQQFQHEKTLYTRSGLLCPPQKILELEEPGLRDLIKKYPKQPKKNAAVFRDNTTKNWKINVTLISIFKVVRRW